MYHLLRYSRIRSTSVESIKDNLLESVCHLRDTLQEAEVRIVVELPDLEIKKVEGWLVREGKQNHIPEVTFSKILGSRIGPGIFKLIKGTVKTEYDQVPFMLEECCRGVILSFTKHDLLRSPRPEDDEEAIEYYANMVKENVRLYNRCAAFAPGSRIVKDIESKG